MVGGVTGASIYKVFVELHHPSPCEHRREIEDEAEEEAAPLDMQKNLSPEVCV